MAKKEKKSLNLNASEKAQLLASFDRIPVTWVGVKPVGGHDDFAPQLEEEVNPAGEPTGKTVLCTLVEKSARGGKIPSGLAKKVTDEVGDPEELLQANRIEIGKVKP